MSRASKVFAGVVIAILASISGMQSAYAADVKLGLEQSIFVWGDANYTQTNFDTAMYYVNSLTGATDLAGYAFQPAVADCPSTMSYGVCEYTVSGAALNYSTGITHLLVSGAAIDSMIYEVNTQTGAVSNPLTLTLNGSNVFYVSAISYNPSGQLIVTKRANPSGDTIFYSVNLSNGHLTQVASIAKTATGNNSLNSIAYAPDGTLYGFVGIYTGSAGSYVTTGEAYVLNLSAGTAALDFTTNAALGKVSFDSSGDLWFQSDLDNNFQTAPSLGYLDVASPATSTIIGTMPQHGGPFVVSDVAKPKSALTLDASSGQQATGTPVEMNAENVRNGSTWALEVHSTPQVIASGSASMAGNVLSSAVLPAGLEAGNHQLILKTTAPNGQTVEQIIDFTIDASGVITYSSGGLGLANTGGNVPEFVPAIALLSVVVGAVAIYMSRRRRLH